MDYYALQSGCLHVLHAVPIGADDHRRDQAELLQRDLPSRDTPENVSTLCVRGVTICARARARVCVYAKNVYTEIHI